MKNDVWSTVKTGEKFDLDISSPWPWDPSPWPRPWPCDSSPWPWPWGPSPC